MIETACNYPPCDEPAVTGRCITLDPKPIGVNVCAEHAADLDSNGAAGTPDFWRWAMAAMGTTG